MQFIHLSKISYTYEGQCEPVFKEISFGIAAGERIALVGDNGEGKSTILRIILGELADYRGEITYPRKTPVIGYLPQDMSLISDLTVREELLSTSNDLYSIIRQIDDFTDREDLTAAQGLKLAELWEEFNRLKVSDYLLKIDTILAELQLDRYATKSCREISEGEKTRLQLGKLLVKEPDILILDEPTNNLDLENMLWLESWIREFPGAVLYVSHDRSFINNTASKIVALVRGSATVVSGNYDTFVTNSENERAHQSVQYQEREKLINKLLEAAQKRRRWASTFQQDTRAEGGGKKFESIFNAVRTMHQQAKHIEQRMEMLQKRYKIEKPWREKERKIRFTPAGPTSAHLVTCNGITKSYGSNLVFKELYFHAERGEKIWFSGRNGSGKSTLMRIIAGLDKDFTGELFWGDRVKIGWFDQNLHNLPAELTLLEYTKNEEREESKIRSFYGCMGLTGEIVNRQIGSLSWGEKTKTQLVKLLTTDYNFLLLDEPTNHLDIATRSMLEDALKEYPGTVIFVSHDRTFISHLATREFSLDLER